jgi:ribosomal protein S27E
MKKTVSYNMPPKKKKAKKTADEEAEGPREVQRRKACPDCGATNVNFDPENEAMICGDCGSIFEEFVVIESKDELDLF